jgi:hypothetical protein
MLILMGICNIRKWFQLIIFKPVSYLIITCHNMALRFKTETMWAWQCILFWSGFHEGMKIIQNNSTFSTSSGLYELRSQRFSHTYITYYIYKCSHIRNSPLQYPIHFLLHTCNAWNSSQTGLYAYAPLQANSKCSRVFWNVALFALKW